MIKSIGILFVLCAATTASATPVLTGGMLSPLPPGIMLVAASGRDTVGGLMPLPLWPPYTPRAYAPAPRVWKHRSRKCSANSC